MSTLQATNLKHNASASNNIVLDNAGNATFAGTAAMASSFLRNRIINGDMRIDQRNAGAAVTVNNGDSQFFAVDRFYAQAQGGGVFTIQRSATAPTGFTNSVIATVTTPDTSITGTDFYAIKQRIEGFNCADFGWGTAGAQTVTLSFWVRSSITGTYTGALMNAAENRAYPFSYTISAANTFEYKTVTIAGDTTGTWVTNNGTGILLGFVLGVGPTYLGTAGAWAGTRFEGATGQTQWISTNGATFFLTGVQLEVGTAATPFERRQFGQELALCQRYAWVPLNNASVSGVAVTSITAQARFVHPVRMRVAPTVSLQSSGSFTISDDYSADITASSVAIIGSSVSVDISRVWLGGFVGLAETRFYAGLPGGANTARILFSAEL